MVYKVSRNKTNKKKSGWMEFIREGTFSLPDVEDTATPYHDGIQPKGSNGQSWIYWSRIEQYIYTMVHTRRLRHIFLEPLTAVLNLGP